MLFPVSRLDSPHHRERCMTVFSQYQKHRSKLYQWRHLLNLLKQVKFEEPNTLAEAKAACTTLKYVQQEYHPQDFLL